MMRASGEMCYSDDAPCSQVEGADNDNDNDKDKEGHQRQSETWLAPRT